MIVAHSQKEAAKIVRTSLKSFRDHWVLQTGTWPIARPKVCILYTRPYGSKDFVPFLEWKV